MRTQAEHLETALFHLKTVKRHATHDLADELVLDACALRLMAMLDALGSLPAETLQEMFGEDWQLMRGMRNRLVHGYATVDDTIIRATIREDLPIIHRKIALRLESMDTNPTSDHRRLPK